MTLNLILNGDDTSQIPVLLAHGLFGSARNLGGIARRLAETRRVISVDMRNHGDSFHDPDHSYPALAEDLAKVIAQFGGRADVIGHSMGGKAVMTLALSHPEMVGRLAVLDISPISYRHNQDGLIAAMQGLKRHGLTLRSEADRRLSTSIDDPGVRAFLLQSLDLKSDPAQWKMNLDALSQQMLVIVGWPDTLAPGAFTGPALVLAGAASTYCDPDGQSAIRRFFPQAQVELLPGLGHWLHAEDPKGIADRLVAFLSA